MVKVTVKPYRKVSSIFSDWSPRALPNYFNFSWFRDVIKPIILQDFGNPFDILKLKS